MIEKIVVDSDQNVVDLCIQEQGDIEGLYALCLRNGIAMDADPAVESLLLVETTEVVKPIVRTFFKNKKMTVATGRIEDQVDDTDGLLTETGFNILTETGGNILME